MGSGGIVVDPPRLDDASCHRQAPEQMLVEAFVAEAPIQAFHEDILDRFAWRDVVSLYTPVLRPSQNRRRR